MDKDLPVICYDTKRVIAGDSQFIKCHQIPWKDIQLVESERVIQPRGATINNSKPAGKRKRYTSVFGEKSKHNH
jgi:hypothetical protein